MSCVILGNRVRLLLAQLVQMFPEQPRAFGGEPAFLRVRSCAPGKVPERGSARERQALEYEGSRDDDAEGEEDDHIALGKRLAVGEASGRKSRQRVR